MDSNTPKPVQRQPAAPMLRYEPPLISVLGSITDLTAAKSGPQSDFFSSALTEPNFPSGVSGPPR
jgi:hypothetical protein